MAQYVSGKLVGIVGYKQLFPDIAMPPLESLLGGLPRIWAVRLVSNMQNKLVGEGFYNPNFRDETTQIDVPRFFFGRTNTGLLLEVIQRYKSYVAQEIARNEQPMVVAASAETPLLLLKHIMAMPRSAAEKDISVLEKNLFLAFMVANEMSMNRQQGEIPYDVDEDVEMYLASLFMSRYAYNDFTCDPHELDSIVRNQGSRTIKFFQFICGHPKLKVLYDDFLEEYQITSWNDYLKTYFSIQGLVCHKTGVIDFDKLKDEDGLITEKIVAKDSIDINATIAFEENIDYETFRKKPFIKVAPHEYAVIDVSFMIKRMYDGLYFIFNELWKKRFPDRQQEFNQIFTTEFSEETVLLNSLKEISNERQWVSFTDKECKAVVPERDLSSPPDFYIRDDKEVYLFECKDVKIRKEVKAEGTIKELLDEVDKDFVGYQDATTYKWRYKGIGQLVRNAKRIQDGSFRWDVEADKNSRITLILVLADARQVDAGWKNYLNRKLFEECERQGVDSTRVYPLILTDLATLVLYKENFKKYGLQYYLSRYFRDTAFDKAAIDRGDRMTQMMNQTMSFSSYMRSERFLGGEELRQDILGSVIRNPKKLGHHSYVTKTVEYADLFDDTPEDVEEYLKGINKRWLIESVVHMISVDSYDSFSMKAERGLLVMFQDYQDDREVKLLFRRIKREEGKYPGIWLTLINHQALFRLLTKVLTLSNEREGKGESFESYMMLLKAILVENSREMEREKEILGNIDGEPPVKDAKIVMQQDLLNLDKFGENKVEIEKSQMLKYMALCEFGRENEQLGEAIKHVVNKHGFDNYTNYVLLAQMPLKVYHDNKKFNEGLYYIRWQDFKDVDGLRLWESFASYVADKCINIWDTEKMKTIFSEKELLDNTCFRIYPVLKMSDEEYLIVSQPYYSHLFYDGFWWSVKEELKNSMSEKAAMQLLTKDFAEKRLFYTLALQMVGDKRISIYNDYCFEANQSSPDIAIRTKHRLFLFEFKDMRVQKEVADGNDMGTVMEYIDGRLNKEKEGKGGNKGLPQLVSNMEGFFIGKKPWGNGCRKGNVKIYPVLVINSRLFGVRGINYIMQEKMRERIQESEVLKRHTHEIGELLVMDYDMLILVASKCYHDFARFQRFLFGYFTRVKKAQNMVERSESFKHYLMNKWEAEKSEEETRRFGRSYKKVVRALLRY